MLKRLSILFIAHERNLNGASKSLLEIIKVLIATERYDIHILTAYNFGPFYREIEKLDVSVICYPYCWWMGTDKNIFRKIFHKIKWPIFNKLIHRYTAYKVARYIKVNNIKLMHSNTSVLDIGMRIKQLQEIFHVVHVREFGDLDFNMHPFIKLDTFKNTMNSYTDAFVFISKAVYNHYDWIPKEKKYLIYNGVSKEQICKRNIIEHELVNILIAGRICNEKGQHLAIKACLDLLKKGISNFCLNLAGSGNPETLVGYKELLNKGRVKYLGLIKDMRKVREHIDLEIVCSKSEAFGRVTAEAMLNGIPVIGSNSGGTPELVIDGVTGLLFESGNYENLATKLEIFIKNKEFREAIGRNAKDVAMRKFTIERCVSDIEAVYGSLINSII